MSDEIGYADAMRELDGILEELERDDLDVDVLAARVRRAGELITLCRARIARAQSDVGRPELALEVIANMQGREVDRLRADVLWKARRWRDAGEQIEKFYGERWREFAPLTEAERQRGTFLLEKCDRAYRRTGTAEHLRPGSPGQQVGDGVNINLKPVRYSDMFPTRYRRNNQQTARGRPGAP